MNAHVKGKPQGQRLGPVDIPSARCNGEIELGVVILHPAG